MTVFNRNFPSFKGCDYLKINDRIENLLNKKGWTKYRLVKESGIPDSTISNIFARNSTPTLQTLEIKCSTLNISLAEFFSDDELMVMTPEFREFYDKWTSLSPEKKKFIIQTIDYIK